MGEREQERDQSQMNYRIGASALLMIETYFYSYLNQFGKCLFLTEGEYIGKSCRRLWKGDVVCILLGCDVPILLRQMSVEEDAWYVIGEACK